MSSCQDGADSGSACEFNQNLSIFREIPLFAGMPIQVHKVLAYLCSRETFDVGESIFQQGDDDGQAIYILSGRAILSRNDESRGLMTIAEYGVGDFLGGLSLMGPSPRLFSLEARTTLICMVLSREKFQHAMEQFPEAMPKALQAVVSRIGDWDNRLLNQPEIQIDRIKEQVGVSVT